MNRMRVLFVLNSCIAGGAEMQMWQLANGLLKRGVACTVRALTDRGGPQVIPPWNEVTVGTIGGNQLYDGRAIRRMGDAILAYKPSVIVTINQRALYYSMIARRRVGSPARIACIFQTSPEHLQHYRHAPSGTSRNARTYVRTAKDRALVHLYRPFFRRCDALVYVSENQRAAWENEGYVAPLTTVIYNGVNVEHFSIQRLGLARDETRATLGIAPSDYVVGLSAEFRPEKNHRQLVDAVANLRKSGCPARALFVGDGPTVQSVTEHADRMGISEHIIFAGYQKDVAPYLASFDTGALPSIAETFSLAALEIMATSRPIVISDVAGAREMVEHGVNGFLFPPGDLAAFTGSLGILADAKMRSEMGANAERTARRFDLHQMVERYLRLFLKLDSESMADSQSPGEAIAQH
jgi:glycosyltransferase involved in cell wall biosynthesis